MARRGRGRAVTGRVVGADPDGLAALASGLAADRGELLEIVGRVRWASAVVAELPGRSAVAVDAAAAARRLVAAADQVDELRRHVLTLADDLQVADRWGWPGVGLERWWRTGSAGIRWLDDTLAVGPDDLTGAGTCSAPELREAIRHGWAAARAVDAATGGRVARGLEGVTAPARGRVDRVAAATARLVGGTRVVTIGARVADVLRAPLVQRAARTVGRVVGVVGVLADGVEAVDRARAGDRWGAARSAATALAGATLLVTTNPVAVAVATVVVAGIHVYEHREAIARSLRTAREAGTRAVGRATSAVRDATVGVGGAATDLVVGARQLVALPAAVG